VQILRLNICGDDLPKLSLIKFSMSKLRLLIIFQDLLLHEIIREKFAVFGSDFCWQLKLLAILDLDVDESLFNQVFNCFIFPFEVLIK
jgi:hypothetical protein